MLVPYWWDHPNFFRVGRRAVAVAAHLYGGVDEAAAWAASVGLIASFPAEESWWNPPRTKLVLYEPGVAGAAIIDLAEWRRGCGR